MHYNNNIVLAMLILSAHICQVYYPYTLHKTYRSTILCHMHKTLIHDKTISDDNIVKTDRTENGQVRDGLKVTYNNVWLLFTVAFWHTMC